MSDTWYFAYGSNLSKDRKQQRTGLIRSSRKVRLANYRLAFNKAANGGGVYANIVEQAGSEVWGVVYLCNPEAMAKLDLNEGVMGGHYEQVQITVEMEDGTRYEADTYVAGERFVVAEEKPTDEYFGFIVNGASEHGLPLEYIQNLKLLAGKDGG